MSKKLTHGGSRPPKRPDDRRLTAKPPTNLLGRKPSKFTLAVGRKFWVAPHVAEGVLDAELWTVTEIDRDVVKITSDNGVTYNIHGWNEFE